MKKKSCENCKHYLPEKKNKCRILYTTERDCISKGYEWWKAKVINERDYTFRNRERYYMDKDEQGGEMRIKIERFEDREKFIAILARNGYKVWEESETGHLLYMNFYVCFEELKEQVK